MKKTISLLLCLILSLTMTAGIVFADEAGEMPNPEEMAAAAETENIPNPEEMAAAAEEEAGTPADPYEEMMASGGFKTVETPLSEEGEIIIEDYSSIEIPENEIAVTDEDVENNISSILAYSTTTESVTEGTVQTGDTVNIDFTGYLAGEEEPFDGGSAQGYTITLGSGTFIPGFEEQIAGHDVGETFDIQITFPEEYAEELAGKDAVFTITLNSIEVSVVPELNDEFAKSFSAQNLDSQAETVEDLKEIIHDMLYHNLLDNAIMKRMQEKTTVTSYKESQFNLLKEYYLADLTSYSEMYAASGMEGYDADTMAQMSGFADAQSYAADEAMYYLDVIMMLDKVAEDKGIEVTDEDVNEVISSFMSEYGYDQTYTLEEFREMNGEAWVLLMTKLNVLYSKVINSLHENVVVTQAEEPAEETVEEVPLSVEELPSEVVDE